MEHDPFITFSMGLIFCAAAHAQMDDLQTPVYGRSVGLHRAHHAKAPSSWVRGNVRICQVNDLGTGLLQGCAHVLAAALGRCQHDSSSPSGSELC